jgi:hypothetical protein
MNHPPRIEKKEARGMSWILNIYYRKIHALSEEYKSPVMKRCSSAYLFQKSGPGLILTPVQ